MNPAASIFISLRPRQWSKNVLLFAALLFSKNLFNTGMTLRAAAGFAVFCMITGAAYILNDILDRNNDRVHPEKSKRPVASGKLPIPLAAASASLIAVLTLASAFTIDRPFALIAAGYLLLQIGYSTLLKNIVIIDVLTVTSGFVLRVFAGAVIIDVGISSWLLICVFLLALFLALCKRRHELVLLLDGANSHRRVLGEYSTALLDQMISVTTASTVIAYTLYTLSEQTIAKFGTAHLVFTTPFVVYSIFRYLYLVHIRRAGGSPEMLLLTDFPLVCGIALWVISASAIIYL